MWLDRFVKIAGRHWLVGEVCPLGINLVCFYNGEKKNFKVWDVESVVLLVEGEKI